MSHSKDTYFLIPACVTVQNQWRYWSRDYCWLSWSHHFERFMTWLTAMEYLCHKWPRICSICRKHFSVRSSFITYHRVCKRINTTGVTNDAGNGYHSKAHEFIPGCLVGFMLLDIKFYVYALQVVVCPFAPILLAIVFSVLPFTDSDNPFRILKLFFLCTLLNHENINFLITAYVNVWTHRPQNQVLRYMCTYLNIDAI
jgi:hypothetical protein